MKPPVSTPEQTGISPELYAFLDEVIITDKKHKVFTPDMTLIKTFEFEDEQIRAFFKLFTERFNIKISDTFNMEERFCFDSNKGSVWDFIRSILLLPILIIILLFSINKLEKIQDMSLAELDKAIKTDVLE